METFAYLQVAQDYENPESKELVFLKDGLAALSSLSGMKLPSQTLFVLLGVASSAFILNIANAAQAALYRGDSGSDVTYLQNLLNDNGYSVPVTGYFGSVTEDQVYSFQYDQGLVGDGVAGSATIAALEGGFVPITPGGGGSLSYGSSGASVTDLQYALNSAGYFSGPYTGYFGSSTEQAVINFQYDNYLTADGVAGPATLAALGTGGFQPILPGGSALSYGDSGAGVSNLQSLLNSNGYSVPITSYFGSQTEQAVINFQLDYGLVADGIAGSNTIAALEGGGGFLPVRPGVGSTYSFGDSGAGVSNIQDLLNANGYPVPITSYFGSQTEQQVISFQIDNGISADGIVGPQTYAALLSR
ncbi:MAG: peptidoglycan-binding protein [Oscillatoriophycideae cyanobacterium NC_groundwater_1537_Pr4_S-0.65um_50_18]|nr:peptidoglycan-binding protein [Oscillatoriophycideae cyanobacterium NC_groundwater_1537_Pr4_S-0.65um_50_18]